MKFTKETVVRIFTHNRKPFAIHQLWVIIDRLQLDKEELLEALVDADHTLWNLGHENNTPVGDQLRKASVRSRQVIEKFKQK